MKSLSSFLHVGSAKGTYLQINRWRIILLLKKKKEPLSAQCGSTKVVRHKIHQCCNEAVLLLVCFVNQERNNRLFTFIYSNSRCPIRVKKITKFSRAQDILFLPQAILDSSFILHPKGLQSILFSVPSKLGIIW